MDYQLPIDFTHPRENNRESEQHYFDNLKKFTKQAEFVKAKLESGEVMTSLSAAQKYQIVDLGARISELRRGNVNVEDEFVTDETGKVTRFKKYFIKK